MNRELRRILEGARVTRVTRAEGNAALHALERKMANDKQFFYSLPMIDNQHYVRAFKHGGNDYAVKRASDIWGDHGANVARYARFAKAFRAGVRKGRISPNYVLVRLRHYGVVTARQLMRSYLKLPGVTAKFLLMERLRSERLDNRCYRLLKDDGLQVADAKGMQPHHAIKLGVLSDGRPILALAHDYS